MQTLASERAGMEEALKELKTKDNILPKLMACAPQVGACCCCVQSVMCDAKAQGCMPGVCMPGVCRIKALCALNVQSSFLVVLLRAGGYWHIYLVQTRCNADAGMRCVPK